MKYNLMMELMSNHFPENVARIANIVAGKVITKPGSLSFHEGPYDKVKDTIEPAYVNDGKTTGKISHDFSTNILRINLGAGNNPTSIEDGLFYINFFYGMDRVNSYYRYSFLNSDGLYTITCQLNNSNKYVGFVQFYDNETVDFLRSLYPNLSKEEQEKKIVCLEGTDLSKNGLEPDRIEEIRGVSLEQLCSFVFNKQNLKDFSSVKVTRL